MVAAVVGVHVGGTHGLGKSVVPKIDLVEGQGVRGDVHCGVTVKHRSRVATDPHQPNLRQVHLLHAELLEALGVAGYPVRPGELGENITTTGLDVLGLPVGARLRIGTAAVTVTGLRNPCQQINDLHPGLLKQVVRRGRDGQLQRLAGIMGVVSRGGMIQRGDQIEVDLPPLPHYALERV